MIISHKAGRLPDLEVDLHIHSMHSPDSLSRPDRIVRRARRLALGAIAVTDHDSWEGYRATASVAEGTPIVVPGAELKTAKGDLLALFVEEEIRTKDWGEAVDRIHSRGGLAVVPHPGMSRKLSADDIRMADAVETFNAKCSDECNARGRRLCEELSMPGIASSDAHCVTAIGNGRTMVRDSSTVEELHGHLLKGPVATVTQRTNPVLHYGNAIVCFGLKGVWKR